MNQPGSHPGGADSGCAVLIKFGRSEHLESLRNSGTLRFSPQATFAKREKDVVRTDLYEGTDEIVQPHELRRLVIWKPGSDSIIIPGDRFLGPVRMGRGGVRRQICCFYAWTDLEQVPIIDYRMQNFGGYFVLITDTQVFLDRVRDAVEAKGLRLECGLVKYFREAAHSGPTGPFQKPDSFAYQSEFRIVITPGQEEPFDLTLGSLEDITTEGDPASRFNELLELSSAGEA